MNAELGGALPYGPATPLVRRFFVQLAALDLVAHDAVVERFAAIAPTRAFAAADAVLSEAIERSGRSDARDALAGPLMQLVREREPDATAGDAAATIPATGGTTAEATDDDAIALDPIAEPALAALLAVLVHDLVPAATFTTLYAAFEPAIPLDSLRG